MCAMRLVVTAPFRVVPPDSGGRRLICGACREYANVTEGFECLALATLNDRRHPSAPFPYRERKTASSLLCALNRLGLASKIPYLESMRCYARGLARRALQSSPRVVEVHLPWLMGVRRHLPLSVMVVLVMQNIESLWYEPAIRNRPGADRLRRRLSILEREGIRLADHVLCLTPEDRDALRELYAVPEDRITVIPPGTDIPESVPPASESGSDRRRAVFVGSPFSGNLEAARELIAAVGSSCGDGMELSIAGGICRDLARDPLPPGVRLVGTPADCAPLFAASDVLLNPGGIGTGIHVKVLDALAMGCRVVSTPLGARGYAPLLGGPIRVGPLTSFAELARSAVRLTPEEMKPVRAYAWPKIVRRRLDLYEQLCGTAREGRDGPSHRHR